MKKNQDKRPRPHEENYSPFFDLSILDTNSMKMYFNYNKSIKRSQGIYVARQNLFSKLGILIILSQIAESQFCGYSLIYQNAKNKSDESTSESLFEYINNDIENDVYSVHKKSEKTLGYEFGNLIKTISVPKNIVTTSYKIIDNRNYLMHHCIAEKPTIIKNLSEIISLTRLINFTIAILNQLITQITSIFYESISNDFPMTGNALNKLQEIINEKLSNPLH